MKYLGECGTPEWIRTTDLLLRRQTLYPSELRAHNTSNLRRNRQILTDCFQAFRMTAQDQFIMERYHGTVQLEVRNAGYSPE